MTVVPWPAALRAVQVGLDVSGAVLLLGLALRWGLVQSLRIRLLAMLHIGFVWLGIAFALSALSHALIEDTALIVALGANVWIVLVGRVAVTLAVIAVLARLLDPDNRREAVPGPNAG